MWSVFEKVAQSNARFDATDTLSIEVHSVRMPVGFGRNKNALTAQGRPLSNLVHLKRSIVHVRAEKDCLAHALVIAIAKLTGDANYKAYRQGRKIGPQVRQLMETTGINLDDGGGIRELGKLQEHFKEYRIVVYAGLDCQDIMYDGNVPSTKRINLLYDDVTRHYSVITNLTGAMARRYVCPACNKGCTQDVTHVCEYACSDCMSIPPCTEEQDGVRYPCADCNRHFRSRTCFAQHKINKMQGTKTVCEGKRRCDTCSSLITRKNHSGRAARALDGGQLVSRGI